MRWQWKPFLGLPLITAITAVVLASGWSLLGGVLSLTCIPLFWLGDVSMMSPALLTDVGHTSSGLLAIRVRVALIGPWGVKYIFLMVSPKLNSTLLELLDPTPYSELKSLSLYWCFLDFLLNFLRAFSSLSNILLNCANFRLAGLGFFLPFLAVQKSAFSFPSLSYL